MARTPDARAGEGGGIVVDFEAENHRKSTVNKTEATTTFVQQLRNLVGSPEINWQKYAYSDEYGEAPIDLPETQVGLSRLIRYGETDNEEDFHPAAILDVRVYVQGVDISEDLKASGFSGDNVGVEGHSTLTFVVDNSENKFVWTEANLREFYGEAHPDRRQQAKAALETGAELPPLTAFFTANEAAKKALYKYKSNPSRNPITTNSRGVPLFAKFDLIPNKTVLQRLDPVRVWVLYPYRVPGGATTELWMPYFTGYVEYVSVDDEDIQGGSSVTVQCADYRHSVLERMRLSTDNTLGLLNPVDDLGFRNSRYEGADKDTFGVRKNSLRFSPNAVNFYDQLVPDLYGQPFSNRPLEGAVSDLLTYKASPTNDNEGRRGVQNCTLGGSFFLNAKSRQGKRAFLEDYHKFTLFGPKRRPWTAAEVDEVGRQTTTDGTFAPHNFRLWFLLPPGGTGAGNLNDLSTISAAAAHAVSWTNRLDVLRKLVGTLDYEMFQSATGDLHVEFNFADFRPEDFGTFKESFRFRNHLKNTQFGDEQSPDPIGALTFVSGFGKGVESKEGTVAGLLQTTVVYAPYLIARYGVTEETVSAPFLDKSEKGTAQARAIIEFQKRNSECNTLSFGSSWRPFLLPNRPVHHIPRTRMGTLVSVSSDFTYGEGPTASVSFSLRHVRTFTGHYRSLTDLIFDDIAVAEYALGGLDTSTQVETIKSMDDYDSTDPLELQVYTSVMGGDFLPNSSRLGWGSTGVVAPTSGVYILDPVTAFQAPLPDSAITAHEDTEDVAKPVVAVEPDTEEAPTTFKFASDPLDSVHVTSAFGKRVDPFTGDPAGHAGVDLRATEGSNLYAVADGTVRQAGQDGIGDRKAYAGNGIVVKYITKDGKYIVMCLHLSVANVSVGDKIVAGQLIGRTGNTGRSKAPHLHIEVKDLTATRKDGAKGAQVDIIPLLPGSVRQVP